jgi:Lon protease-like protein
MSHTVRVNFSKPVPLFPLPCTVLLPHAVQPLHIFEPRYRQMIDDCLDTAGQIAMACFAPQEFKQQHDPPVLRPAVCIGQIVQHDLLSDGCHNVLLHGVCRATIKEMLEPDNGRLYRMAKLTPLEATDGCTPALEQLRDEMHTVLSRPRLQRLRSIKPVLEWFDRSDVPTHALLELVGFTLVHDPELKYDLLAEADVLRRADLISSELDRLDRLILIAEGQGHKRWDKGVSWN